MGIEMPAEANWIEFPPFDDDRQFAFIEYGKYRMGVWRNHTKDRFKLVILGDGKVPGKERKFPIQWDNLDAMALRCVLNEVQKEVDEDASGETCVIPT